MREKANVEVLTTVEALVGWRFFVPLLTKAGKEVYLGSVVRHVIWPKRERLTSVCISLGNKVMEDVCGESVANYSYFRQLALPIWVSPDLTRPEVHIRKVIQSKSVDQTIPYVAGNCGIYGCKTYTELLRQTSFTGVLFGESKFWGKTIVGDVGYRARYAYPKSLAGGLCRNCRKVLSLKDLVLYFDSTPAAARYLGHIKKYQVYCSRCFFSKERNRANRGNKTQYLGQLCDEYGVTIVEDLLKG